MFCVCGHSEDEHVTTDDGEEICLGDGRFSNGDPVCDCDSFDEDLEPEEEDA